MTRRPVTATLLHDLVARSHAEGTTRLAITALIEDGDRILLIEADDTGRSGYTWAPPGDLVLPGETLSDAVHRTAAGTGTRIDRITGYLGCHDVLTGHDVLRTFVFAATPQHHGRDLPGHHPYQWAANHDLPDDILRLLHLAAPAVCDHQDSQRLHAALRGHARGLLALEAAVELLIGHRFWLCRNDFTAAYVEIDAYPETALGLPNPTLMACIDWPAAITALDTGALPCSTSEARMLRVAASLAEGIPVDLRHALTGLDTDNLDLVTQAVLHTAAR